MSFGISSVPEVFQQRMHELGITGTEVVADDFMATGFVDTYGEAVCDHNRNLLVILQRCSQHWVKLALEIPQLHLEDRTQLKLV